MGQQGAPVANLVGGQPGLMRRPSEALSQPALDPLLAAFSAQMGVGQVSETHCRQKHHSTSLLIGCLYACMTCRHVVHHFTALCGPV